ncbi:hypothetical protein [Kitasatospora sp. SUK 42]|uniref:hypothetical protein n=1 Tax=Kitasatospora sp. SUK 42 TaxID=1588882 RepID=UPI0018CBA42D|nr:hypothetical protein [Kitasatospora sp. SUK 42]MBV2152713.1 hypothetical protein [Kitasatospora sp. SUK 42]
MPTRQLRDAPPPTHRPVAPALDAPEASREPVLLGDVLFHTLAELARRTPDPAPALPTQRTRPHP